MAEMIFGLVGGLALFIYGIQCMGEGLQKLTADKLRKVFSMISGLPVIGVLLGAGVTAVVQSSSLTTVLAVSFVNASLMSLKQAIAVIMGANIGTTITAQLVAFQITKYWAALLGIGFIIYFFCRRKKLKNGGYIIFSLGLLLLGMVTMSQAMYPLRESEAFFNMIAFFSQYKILGLLAGMVFTAIVQSSSAAIGLLIAMASTGVVPLDAALPVLLGANIGTCITAMLAAIGASVPARRVALAHVLFNLAGSLIFMAILPWFYDIVIAVSASDEVARQIANAHTLFNVIATLLFLPLINKYTALVTWLIHDKPSAESQMTVYLDWQVTNIPELAVGLARKELLHMGKLAADNLRLSVEGLLDKDADKLERVKQQEDIVDGVEKEICRYLAAVAQKPMSEMLSVEHTGLLHAANDIERISDHADNIADLAQGMIDEHLDYSAVASEHLRQMYALSARVYEEALTALEQRDLQMAAEAQELEQQVDELEHRLRSQHMRRLVEGSCQAEAGVLFLDVISNLERVSDHANNIANITQGKI
ncbi:MAG: Na/Pi cotransporter family protein [Bacillota bacterium]|nr:Na/Pi cotransporter family protein [Bacillota bacterium]